MKRCAAILVLLGLSVAASAMAASLPYSQSFSSCSDRVIPDVESPATCADVEMYSANRCTTGGNNLGAAITSLANYSGGAGGKGIRTYNGGNNNPDGGQFAINLDSNQSEIWIRFYARFQSTWQYANNAAEDFKLIWITDQSHMNSGAIFSLQDAGLCTRSFKFWNQDMSPEVVCGSTDKGFQWVNGGNTGDGKWHLYEVHLKRHTTTSPYNGEEDIWVDGTNVLHRNDINFGSMYFRHIRFNVNTKVLSPSTCQYIDIDDIAISNTGRIGAIGSVAPIPIGDTTPPVISNSSPSGALAYGSTATNMTVTTDEVATCKYGTSDVAYASMPNTFATTGTTSHSQPLNGLTNGGSYAYYVRCIDGNYNSNTSSTPISFSVSNTAQSSSTLLFAEEFDNTSFSSRGWYDGLPSSIATSNCYSGTGCAEFTFASGGTNPTQMPSGGMRRLFTSTDSLYVSFYIKFATGWRGSQKTYHPHMFFILSNLDDDWAGMANAYLDTYIEFISDVGNQYAIRPQLAIQDAMRVNYSLGTPPNNLISTTENRSVGYCNTPMQTGATGDCFTTGGNYWWSSFTWNNPSTSLTTNAWHKVEVFFKMNTISGNVGQRDGIMQEWIDGVQIINRTDVLYRTNQDSTKKWHQFAIAPYIGDGSPIVQTFYIDNLNVWNGIPSSTSSPATTTVTIKSVSP